MWRVICDDDDAITDHDLVISSGTDIVKIVIKCMDGEFPISKPEFDEPEINEPEYVPKSTNTTEKTETKLKLQKNMIVMTNWI